MPKFSRTSLQRLLTCDKRLQQLMQAVIKEQDIVVICGHRGEQEQNEAYEKGTSQLSYPYSKHNSDPSRAVDIAPYHADEPHIHWENVGEFIELSKIIKLIAKNLGINIIWGGDWKMKDYPHYEIKE